MAIGGIAPIGKGKTSSKVINETGNYTTQRPTTQQKSSLATENETHEEVVTEIGRRVIKSIYGAEEIREKQVVKANTKWEQLLEINEITSDGKTIPTDWAFATDEAYTQWVLAGNPDKLFVAGKNYVVLRIWVEK